MGQTVKFFKPDLTAPGVELPFAGKVVAGFASPAADYQSETIDINKLIIKNKDYTFIAKIEGTSMIDAALNDGDLVVIDRSLEPRDNDKVLVYLDGGFTIKFVSVDKEANKAWLVPANKDFPKVEISATDDCRIWGVVTYSITKHRK